MEAIFGFYKWKKKIIIRTLELIHEKWEIWLDYMIWVQTFAVLFRFGHWKHLQYLKKSDRLRLTPMHYYPANVVSQINDILIKFEAT